MKYLIFIALLFSLNAFSETLPDRNLLQPRATPMEEDNLNLEGTYSSFSPDVEDINVYEFLLTGRYGITSDFEINATLGQVGATFELIDGGLGGNDVTATTDALLFGVNGKYNFYERENHNWSFISGFNIFSGDGLDNTLINLQLANYNTYDKFDIGYNFGIVIPTEGDAFARITVPFVLKFNRVMWTIEPGLYNLNGETIDEFALDQLLVLNTGVSGKITERLIADINLILGESIALDDYAISLGASYKFDIR